MKHLHLHLRSWSTLVIQNISSTYCCRFCHFHYFSRKRENKTRLVDQKETTSLLLLSSLRSLPSSVNQTSKQVYLSRLTFILISISVWIKKMLLDILLFSSFSSVILSVVSAQEDGHLSPPPVFPHIPNPIHYPIYIPVPSGPPGQVAAESSMTASSTIPNPITSTLSGLTAGISNPFETLTGMASAPWISPLNSDSFADWNSINPFMEVYDEQDLLRQKELLNQRKQMSRERDELRSNAADTRARMRSSIANSYYDGNPSQEDIPSSPLAREDSSDSRRRPVFSSSSEQYHASFPTTDMTRLPRKSVSSSRNRSRQSEQIPSNLSGIRGNISRYHRYFSRINSKA